MLGYGVIINIILAVLNMIPVRRWTKQDRVLTSSGGEQYCSWKGTVRRLLGLFAFGILGRIISPIIGPLLYWLLGENIF
jgi:hypothetical protein